jgi:hypothetical protein
LKTKTFRPFHPSIPFSNKALEATLNRLEAEFEEYRGTRDRDAVFKYLAALYAAVMSWGDDAVEYSRQALRLAGHYSRIEMEPFAAVILCSAAGGLDPKTISKWSRLLRYAAEYKKLSEPLRDFIRRKGGINACAARFTVRLGRKSENTLRRLKSGSPPNPLSRLTMTCK